MTLDHPDSTGGAGTYEAKQVIGGVRRGQFQGGSRPFRVSTQKPALLHHQSQTDDVSSAGSGRGGRAHRAFPHVQTQQQWARSPINY